MMKQVSFAFLALMLVLSSCDTFNVELGNGHEELRSYEVDNFEEVFLNGNYEVFLEKGTVAKVEIKTDENLFEHIQVDSRKGTFAITNLRKIKDRDGVKVFITFEEIERLVSGGASSVYSNSVIETEDLNISMSGAGLIDLELEVENLEVQLSGAGLIELAGKTIEQNISLTGAGSLEAFDLESENCEISISGVGGAEINVTGHLTAKVSGVGGITYRGNPEDIRREVSGIGSIRSD